MRNIWQWTKNLFVASVLFSVNCNCTQHHCTQELSEFKIEKQPIQATGEEISSLVQYNISNSED